MRLRFFEPDGGFQPSRMRLVSGIWLSVLIASLFMPTQAGVLYQPCNDEAVFLTLDVCHTSLSAVSGTSEMPSLCCCSCKPVVPGFCCFIEGMDKPINLLIVIHEKDRPPRS